jgi:hypothetical protein
VQILAASDLVGSEEYGQTINAYIYFNEKLTFLFADRVLNLRFAFHLSSHHYHKQHPTAGLKYN